MGISQPAGATLQAFSVGSPAWGGIFIKSQAGQVRNLCVFSQFCFPAKLLSREIPGTGSP